MNDGSIEQYSGDITIPEKVYYGVGMPTAVEYTVTGIGQGAFAYCKELATITLPATLRDIQYGAFEEDSLLNSITIPAFVENIGNRAFYNCMLLYRITCEPGIPPTVADDAFGTDDPFDGDRVLEVPTGSAFAYREATWTAAFDSIHGTFLGNSNVDEVTNEAVTIRWVSDPEIEDYTVRIYTADTLYREYKVDKEGNMTRLKMPVYRMRMDTAYSSTDFCVLSINSMQSSTTYTYEITGIYPKPDQPVYYEVGMFRTSEDPMGMEEVRKNEVRCTKVTRDGQVYLLFHGRTYDVRGREIKNIITK